MLCTQRVAELFFYEEQTSDYFRVMRPEAERFKNSERLIATNFGAERVKKVKLHTAPQDPAMDQNIGRTLIHTLLYYTLNQNMTLIRYFLGMEKQVGVYETIIQV